MRLKQATASVADFQMCFHANSPDEAMRILRGTAAIDVVFVTGTLDHSSFTAFVNDAKTTPQGEDAAYIMVLKSTVSSHIL